MIKRLTDQEAKQLREMVMERFLKSEFNGAGIRITQYKNNYLPLAKDIIQKVPDVESSVTTNRLRKLFYYSDPNICKKHQLVKPSFGDDFIFALRQYVEPKFVLIPENSKPWRLPLKWWWIGTTLLLLLAISIFGWWKLNQPTSWEENFDDISKEGLNSRGWEILDFDSLAFSKQLKPGYLTLYTLRGDYWGEPSDTLNIPNLLLRRIGGEKFKISIRIDSFNPYQDYQQAGIILLDKNKSRIQNIRMTLATCESCTPSKLIVQIIKRENGETYEKQQVIRAWQNGSKNPNPLINFWMQIEFENDKFKFFFHEGEEYGSYLEIAEIDYNFNARYLAIAAFRGLRDSQRNPNNSDAIPAFLNYVKFESLPK